MEIVIKALLIHAAIGLVLYGQTKATANPDDSVEKRGSSGGLAPPPHAPPSPDVIKRLRRSRKDVLQLKKHADVLAPANKTGLNYEELSVERRNSQFQSSPKPFPSRPRIFRQSGPGIYQKSRPSIFQKPRPGIFFHARSCIFKPGGCKNKIKNY